MDCRHHTADVGKTEFSPLEMDLTNMVVLGGKGLEDDALVLPICRAFWWIARVDTVPAANHVVQLVVEVSAGVHPLACHPDMLRPNGRP